MKILKRNVLLLCLGITLMVSQIASPKCNGQTIVDYHNRADQALQSFLVTFWNGSQQYLRNRSPDDGTLTGYWTYANGWESLLDGVERTRGNRYYGLIETFYQGQDARGWGSDYFDDECWMTMALIRSYELTGDSKYLNKAVSIFADIQTAWDATCCGATPGGLWWDRAHTQKATAANAGAALVAARLYRHTSTASQLAFAKQAYSFWRSHMVDATTHQVADHMDPKGNKVWWKFTYNEGLMIGAAVELGEATGDSTYLAHAYQYASFMISNEVVSTKYGKVLYDGSSAGCLGDCAQFKGPAYRHLMRLFAKDTTKMAYNTVLKASADGIWNLDRNTNSILFGSNWAGPVQTVTEQMEDNVAATALSRFAGQYGPFPGIGLPSNQYEAEDATLHHVSLESSYGRYAGWGYVANWNGDGQGVDFHVKAPSAGSYRITLRYAAGAGNASRQITVNGASAAANLVFPATGAWSNYTSVSVIHGLPAGASTISVTFNASQGSKNWLNLDNIKVTPAIDTSVGPLATEFDGGPLRIVWTSLGVLQSAPAPAGPWLDVPGNPASPFQIQAVDSAGFGVFQFFRLRQ